MQSYLASELEEIKDSLLWLERKLDAVEADKPMPRDPWIIGRWPSFVSQLKRHWRGLLLGAAAIAAAYLLYIGK